MVFLRLSRPQLIVLTSAIIIIIINREVLGSAAYVPPAARYRLANGPARTLLRLHAPRAPFPLAYAFSTSGPKLDRPSSSMKRKSAPLHFHPATVGVRLGKG